MISGAFEEAMSGFVDKEYKKNLNHVCLAVSVKQCSASHWEGSFYVTFAITRSTLGYEQTIWWSMWMYCSPWALSRARNILPSTEVFRGFSIINRTIPMVFYPTYNPFDAQLQTMSAAKFGMNMSGQNLRYVRRSLNDLGWKESEVVWFEPLSLC